MPVEKGAIMRHRRGIPPLSGPVSPLDPEAGQRVRGGSRKSRGDMNRWASTARRSQRRETTPRGHHPAGLP